MTGMATRIRKNGVQALVLVLTGFFLLVPLVGSAVFGFTTPEGKFTLKHLQTAVGDSQFGEQLWLTMVLAVLTIVGLFVLLVPTLILLHLKLPRMLPLAETFSIIPYVVPAVALVNGANLTFRPLFPSFLANQYSLVPFYIILALPLVYRTIDAGLRALNLSVLVDASRSLGASWTRTVLTVIVPNLKTSLITGALLAVTLVLSEFALAQLLLQNTFPVFLTSLGRNVPRGAAAMSFLVIVGTWILLSAFTGAGRSRSSVGAAIGGSSSSTKGQS